MRRVLGIAIASVVALGLFASPSSAAVKAGASCKKAGQVATAGSMKFTCVKSGKKLVWSKGVAVKKAAAPAVSTESSPTVDETKVAAPVESERVLSPLEKMNQTIYRRYLAAEKKISPSFNFVRCPKVDSAMSEITESSYIDAYSFWVPIYKSTTKVNWLLMSENDWDCWYETTAKFEGENSVSRGWKVWNKDSGVLGHCTVRANAFCGYGTGAQPGGVFAQYNLIGSDYKTKPTPLTVHHETVHIYQAQLLAENFSTSKANTAACWFMEGQANLFGVPIALNGVVTSQRNFEKSRLLRVYPQGSSYSKAEWLGVLNALKTDSDFCFKNELGYSLGWFALEWTYMNYSIEQMHDFLESMAKGSTWAEAIQKVLKMDEQTYYGQIAQYLADEL
jgi:hypothetical protein